MPKGFWERIPFDFDAEPSSPTPDPPAAPATRPSPPGFVTPRVETTDPIQQRIDELCEQFNQSFRGSRITGPLLSLFSQHITEDVGFSVVVTVDPSQARLVGYALPSPSPRHRQMQIDIHHRIDFGRSSEAVGEILDNIARGNFLQTPVYATPEGTVTSVDNGSAPIGILPCPSCEGSGFQPRAHEAMTPVCRACNGRGVRPQS